MNSADTNTENPAVQINHLHEEVLRLSNESRRSLDGALSAAWRAGKLLSEHKQQLRRTAGRGCWVTWLDTSFSGSRSTAYRYMQLAREVSNPATLRGLSLRQVYFRLGIATEPKTRAQLCPVQSLPEPVVLAQKLIRHLRNHRAPEANCIQDLVTLYRQLRNYLESQVSCNGQD